MKMHTSQKLIVFSKFVSIVAFLSLPSTCQVINNKTEFLLSRKRGQNSSVFFLYINENTSTQDIADDSCFVPNDLSYLPWKNKNDLMSYDLFLQCEKILTAILIPVVCIVGIPANIINCIVFYKHGLRQRINFLLFSHSCTDLAYVCYQFLYMSDRFYSLVIGQYQTDGPIGQFMTNSGLHTFLGFTFASGFISTFIACERCLCIIRPFKGERFLKTKTVCGVVCSATVFLVCLHYISTERYKMLCVFDPDLQISGYVFFPSNFYVKNTLIVNIISGALFGIGLQSVFVIVTVVTTVVTAITLRLACAWRLEVKMSKASQKEIPLTKMLIYTSCLFIACKSADTAIRITPLVVPGFRVGGRFQNTFMSSVFLYFFLSTVNATFNICIYFKMGSKYRSTFKYMCTNKKEC